MGLGGASACLLPAPGYPPGMEPVRPLENDALRPVIHGPWSEPDEDQNLDPLAAGRSPDVRRQLAKRVLQQAFSEASLTMDDMATQRVVVSWRILRRWGMLLGHPAAGGSLKPFFTAWHPRKPLPAAGGALEAEEWELPPDLMACLADWAKDPLPLMPATFSERDAIRYTNMIEAVGNYLGIPAGSRDNRGLGNYGMKYLIEPDMIQDALPSPYSLVAWEDLVVDTAMQQLASRGVWSVVLWCRAKFALADDESKLIVDRARAQAEALTAASEPQNRALMQLRFEKLAEENMRTDPRVALQANKTLAMVQGLTRGGGAGGGEDMEDWEDALAEVVDDDQREAMRELGLDQE